MRQTTVSLTLFLTVCFVSAGVSEALQTEVDNANFDVLLSGKSVKKAKKQPSFFKFPEAKQLAESKLENEQLVEPTVINDPNLTADKTAGKARKLRRKTDTGPHPKQVKLDAEIDKLLPDYNDILNRLKPTALPRRLKSSKPKKDAKQSARNQITEDAKEAADSLAAFKEFNKEAQESAFTTNDQLIKQYERKLDESRENAEQDYQSFIHYASDQYLMQISILFQQEDSAYERTQARITSNLARSIENGVRQHSRKLDAELMDRFRQLTNQKFNILSKDIETMQNFYNKIFAEDKKLVNKINQVDLPVPESQAVWDSKDDIYKSANLRPEMTKK